MRLSVSDLLEILSNAYFCEDVRTRAHIALASRLEALDAECPPIPTAAANSVSVPAASSEKQTVDPVLNPPWGMQRIPRMPGLYIIDTHAGPLD